MNKRFKTYAIGWVIAFAVFNAICFDTPIQIAGINSFGGTFWVSYISVCIAFIGQLVCAYIALKTDNLTKLFYNIPFLRSSYIGLILSLIVGSVCMAIPAIPSWIGAVVCLLVLAFSAISVISAWTSADTVNDIDIKVKTQTMFVKSLTADAANLVTRAKDAEIKKEAQRVYEAIRYSDPASNDALEEIESEIAVKFDALKKAVNDDDHDKAREVSEEIVILIDDRNGKCKLLK